MLLSACSSKRGHRKPCNDRMIYEGFAQCSYCNFWQIKAGAWKAESLPCYKRCFKNQYAKRNRWEKGIVDGILYTIFTYLTRRLTLQEAVNCCLKTSSLTSDDLLGFWHWWNSLPGCLPPFSAGVCVCVTVCYLACVSEFLFISICLCLLVWVPVC